MSKDDKSFWYLFRLDPWEADSVMETSVQDQRPRKWRKDKWTRGKVGLQFSLKSICWVHVEYRIGENTSEAFCFMVKSLYTHASTGDRSLKGQDQEWNHSLQLRTISYEGYQLEALPAAGTVSFSSEGSSELQITASILIS